MGGDFYSRIHFLVPQNYSDVNKTSIPTRYGQKYELLDNFMAFFHLYIKVPPKSRHCSGSKPKMHKEYLKAREGEVVCRMGDLKPVQNNKLPS